MFFTILSWLLFGWVTANMAHHRGRDRIFWFFAGMVLGLLGIVIIYFLPPKFPKKAAVTDSQSPHADPNTTNSLNQAGKVWSSTSPGKLVDVTSSVEITNVKMPEYPSITASLQWYYYDEARQQHGPVDFAALAAQWKAGVIHHNSFIWCQGLTDWVKPSAWPDFLKEINTN